MLNEKQYYFLIQPFSTPELVHNPLTQQIMKWLITNDYERSHSPI